MFSTRRPGSDSALSHPSYVPVGRSLAISGPTFSVYKRPVIIPNSAGSSEDSCSQDTEVLPVGLQGEVPTHPTSCCAPPLCCHPARRLPRPPMCRSPHRADSCKREQRLLTLFSQLGSCGRRCAHWLNGGRAAHLRLLPRTHIAPGPEARDGPFLPVRL